MPEPDRFLLTVCQIGAERALKEEVSRVHPELRAAFARPGLVTFKSTGTPVGPRFALRSVLARAWAAALGPAAGIDEVLAAAERVRAGGRMRLHVWERDAHRPGEEPPHSVVPRYVGPAAAVHAALLAAPNAPFLAGDVAQPGEHVLDVVVAGGEPLFVAHHVHENDHSPFPGGRIPVEMPAEAPSRAYRKIEEALSWSRAPLRRGQVAVEIGSAPGGASYALLGRGLEVVGIDPGAMSPVVLASPHFRHLQLAVADVRPEDLPAHVDWLVLDVNLAPQVALHAVRGLVSALRPSLRGVLFTLKLNDWTLAAKIPDLLRRIEEMNITGVRATQLPSNRQEIFAYGKIAKAAKPSAGAKATKGKKRSR